MIDWRGIVGTNVRRARHKAGLTQKQLALEAKIDLTCAGGIERGRRNPSSQVLTRIADALGVEPADLRKR